MMLFESSRMFRQMSNLSGIQERIRTHTQTLFCYTQKCDAMKKDRLLIKVGRDVVKADENQILTGKLRLAS